MERGVALSRDSSSLLLGRSGRQLCCLGTAAGCCLVVVGDSCAVAGQQQAAAWLWRGDQSSCIELPLLAACRGSLGQPMAPVSSGQPWSAPGACFVMAA
eukprot:362445-Chlamydomonas_euryale.AAC.5